MRSKSNTNGTSEKPVSRAIQNCPQTSSSTKLKAWKLTAKKDKKGFSRQTLPLPDPKISAGMRMLAENFGHPHPSRNFRPGPFIYNDPVRKFRLVRKFRTVRNFRTPTWTRLMSCILDILPIIPLEYQTALKKCGKSKHSNCVVYCKPNSSSNMWR